MSLNVYMTYFELTYLLGCSILDYGEGNLFTPLSEPLKFITRAYNVIKRTFILEVLFGSIILLQKHLCRTLKG